MANLIIAYVLWLIGGWWGLHHFYLRRDKHAFVWWVTSGGFGSGWIRDLWRLPEYVNVVNKNPVYLAALDEKARRYPSPPFSVVRFVGELKVGFLFGMLVYLAIPLAILITSLGHILSIIVPPLGVAVGVYLVGNVDPERVDFQWALLGSYMPLLILMMESGSTLIYSAILSAILVNWKGKEWNKNFIRKRGFCKRICVLAVWGVLYQCLWTNVAYLGATRNDGDEVPLRGAGYNFFTSSSWEGTQELLRNLYKYYHTAGTTYGSIVGEGKAYKVLHLRESATDEEIKASYKELVKKWHPDKQKDSTNILEAHEKFIEIQQAYDTLSKIKIKRARRNKMSRKHKNEHEHT